MTCDMRHTPHKRERDAGARGAQDEVPKLLQRVPSNSFAVDADDDVLLNVTILHASR